MRGRKVKNVGGSMIVTERRLNHEVTRMDTKGKKHRAAAPVPGIRGPVSSIDRLMVNMAMPERTRRT